MILITQITRDIEKNELYAEAQFINKTITVTNKYDIHYILELESRYVSGQATVERDGFPTEHEAQTIVKQLLEEAIHETKSSDTHHEAELGGEIYD